MARKTNKTTMAVKMQAQSGVFEAPSPVTDIYPISNLQFSIQGVTVANPEYTGSVHKNGPDLAGKTISGSFNINMRPPGGADVPLADAYIPGRILKAAKFTESRVSAAIPAAPEAVGAATTTTVTLGAGAVGAASLYKGMALLLPSIAAQPYDQITAIRYYTAAKSAGLMELLAAPPVGNYQIPKQLSYQRSISESDAPFLSVKLWLDGLRYDLVDFRISGFRWVMPVSTRDGATTPTFEVSYTATIDDYDDEATPSVPALGATPLFKDGKLFVANKAVGGSNLSIDFGLRTAYPPDPNYADGSAGGELVETTTTVSMDRQAYLKAQFDTLAMAEGQAQYAAYAQWGYQSGKLVQVVVPDFRFGYQSPSLGQDYITETGDMYVDVFDRNVCVNFPYWG
ncbi:hypothetical protein HNO88_002961 [Novosphingobium chloroacetimidivorans]|uniref:Uncharacterized protein n=1 Tax=Novosphingobium chloroacetimidivorans TaxID=1428314 RepID=A0A7W7KB88_9SPHN|nr:hypothetical protein [Novosphingobium chloroacetimidivorans]MBB4859632.1 hypothetical protein [Novosphingobium chloroacetimidivorans]